ncbi:MAG: beta-class carbonic anhydrase [Phycisphaeraceae bacterium]
MLVVTCMDARINVEAALGFKPGEAHILRNAGGNVTDDVLRSAIISTNLMGTRQIMVINHTNCGMMNCTSDSLRQQFTERYGPAENAPIDFHTIDDLSQHAHAQVAKLRDHPWIPSETIIRGFTYDVQTGRLHDVEGD